MLLRLIEGRREAMSQEAKLSSRTRKGGHTSLPGPVVLKLESVSESSGGLAKVQTAGPTSRVAFL